MAARSLKPLPIDDVLADVVARLRQASSLVLCAPPGAGKTTRVPPALLDGGIAGAGKILVLQPRRVAARATAARISAERGSPLGEETGYRVRFEAKAGKATRIEIVTEGILLRRLLSDSFLDGVSCVVFDEFHERSLAADLTLGMVRQVQELRPELKIVVMSATLAAEPVAKYLGGAPVVVSEGRTFPVAIRYQPDLSRRPLADSVASAAEAIVEQTSGDCLVFLPGVGEIRAAAKRLEGWAADRGLLLMELYGDLSAAEQDRVLAPAERRKLILATNVAETSLTIDGVTAVVDSGLARIARYDENSGLDHLELGVISRAAADQRAGRAGRTAAGVCLRLWPEASHRSRPDFDTPEIRRVDLAPMVLQLLCWIEPDIGRFPWFEAPSEKALTRARELLDRLGVTADGAVTNLGREIAALPVHPRLGRMLLEGAARGVGERAAIAAALLSERDPFERTPGRPQLKANVESDVVERVAAVEQFETTGALASSAGVLQFAGAKQLLRVRDQFLRLLPGEPAQRPLSERAADQALERAIAVAYPDRIARRREPHSPRAVLANGKGVRLTPDSAVLQAEFFACVDLAADEVEAKVRQASAVERDWLPTNLIRNVTAILFDEAQERLIARKQTWYDALLLDENPAALPKNDATAAEFVAAALARWERVRPAPETAAGAYWVRWRNLANWLPELELPPLDDAQLQALLPMLIADRRSFAELRTAPWLDAMKSLLTYAQQRAIDEEAPERIEVPSGSRIAIQYEPEKPPILAVRIQEIFGWRETPRIARGRTPLLLHLLAPNMRPEQITADLAGFWRTTYQQVRKDLRGRYPKHAWPENPLEATAERRPRRKNSP